MDSLLPMVGWNQSRKRKTSTVSFAGKEGGVCSMSLEGWKERSRELVR